MRAVRIGFLGTGAAFSVERYNGAVVVDGRLLLDAGAPVLPHLHRLGIEPAAIEAVFLTHFHGDHVLGLPTFILHRAFLPGGSLTVVGPPGVEERVETLLQLAWGSAWPEHRGDMDLRYHEAGASGEAPVLLTSGGIRSQVRAIVERVRPSKPVLAQAEIHPRARIRTVGAI